MPTEYREIYDILSEKLCLTDDLLREAGIDAKGGDLMRVSTTALLVLYARRIRVLEEQVRELQGDVAALELDVVAQED